jgi:uncharacterized protein YndB with AHSA1/START domain
MEANVSGRRANALKRELTIRARATSTAPPEVVYDVLADLRSHAQWGGERQKPKTRLIAVDAPEDPAGVGTEFRTRGTDPMGEFADTSVVTEAERPRMLEFVTEARLTTRKGKIADWTNVHRYEIAPAGTGSRISYSARIARITELPGALSMLNMPILSAVAMKASAGVARRGVENLARVAEERASR